MMGFSCSSSRGKWIIPENIGFFGEWSFNQIEVIK